jgi:hypothetical protein
MGATTKEKARKNDDDDSSGDERLLFDGSLTKELLRKGPRYHSAATLNPAIVPS